MITRILLSFAITLIGIESMAQSGQDNNPTLQLNDVILDRIGTSADIYTGRVYLEQTYPMSGSPYLTSDSMALGWIAYNGQFYPQVRLQWDVFQNYVLVRALNGHSKVILRNELIDSFSFSGHHVKQFQADKEHNLSYGGLYDVLYDEKIRLIVRRKKENRAVIDGRRVVYHFRSKDNYYVRKDGTYYRVSNRADVLRLFHDHTAGVKREVRRVGLSWNRDFEAALLTSVMYYDKAR